MKSAAAGKKHAAQFADSPWHERAPEPPIHEPLLRPELRRCWGEIQLTSDIRKDIMNTKAREFARYNDRQAILFARRSLKMARSAHAYVRGNTRKFYEWLETADVEKVPRGPAVWICGDCHVGNLGPVASAKGHIDIQIRDLDQTVIGNPAHDLIRLGLSLATAARGSDLPGVTTAKMLENMMAGYEQTFGPDASSLQARSYAPIATLRSIAYARISFCNSHFNDFDGNADHLSRRSFAVKYLSGTAYAH
jgi:Uncharacterized protein conserved in bacteria (DUF2252)